MYMDKSEFLDIMRQSLSGEVDLAVIEQNISYYSQYISGQEDEDRIISELGDPRLIAKTIIETDRIAKEKGKFTGNQGSYSGHKSVEEEEEGFRQSKTGPSQNMFFTNFKWYHKLIAVLVVIALFIMIAIVGRLIIGFLFAFGLPIILILFVMYLFRKR